MYLTGCPLRGLGHNSSVGERMYHTVCMSSLWPRVMIAQWENECISLSVLPVARVKFQCSHGGVFQGIHPWQITLCKSVLSQQKMAQSPLNDTIQPVNIAEEGRSSPRTDNG